MARFTMARLTARFDMTRLTMIRHNLTHHDLTQPPVAHHRSAANARLNVAPSP
jgi:hypothetical protein